MRSWGPGPVKSSPRQPGDEQAVAQRVSQQLIPLWKSPGSQDKRDTTPGSNSEHLDLKSQRATGPSRPQELLSALSQKLSAPHPNPHVPLPESQGSSLTVRKRWQLALQLEEEDLV